MDRKQWKRAYRWERILRKAIFELVCAKMENDLWWGGTKPWTPEVAKATKRLASVRNRSIAWVWLAQYHRNITPEQ